MAKEHSAPEEIIRRVALKHKSLRDKQAATILLTMTDVEALLKVASLHIGTSFADSVAYKEKINEKSSERSH